MAIPEPEFSITIYQLDKIIRELNYDWGNDFSSKIEYLKFLRSKCYDHLDTI